MKKEEKHVYYNSKGDEIPSVTHILRIISKRSLVDWANYMGFRHINTKKFVEDKARIGTFFHDRVECYFQKKEWTKPFDCETEETVNKIFNNFMIWAKEANPEIIAEEKEYTNEEYGGKLDLLCSIKGVVTLVDFKTSKSIHATQFLQLGGYLNLIYENDPELYDKIQLCQIVACTPSDINIKSKDKREMYGYQHAFTKAFEIYKAWGHILKTEWNETIE